MIRFVLLLFIFSLALGLHAQDKRADVSISLNATGNEWKSETIALPLSGTTPFLAYSFGWQGDGAALQVRFSKNKKDWKEWQNLPRDMHEIEGESRKYSVLAFEQSAMRYVQVRSSFPTDELRMYCYSPGVTQAVNEGSNPSVSSRFCPCPLPAFQSREDWCPDGNCPEHPEPAYTNVTHIIIHHSAGSNTSNDWAAIVRSIWDFHVNTRGWSDIGYNWLIAPTGVIYQGRKNDWIGAHFCSANTNTMGICMMGTYIDVLPEDAAVQSLRELVAWKSCESDIDPLAEAFHPSTGMVLPQVAGHRDGCATECPGSAFYATFPDLRQEIVDFTTNNCSSLARPTDLQADPVDENIVALSWVDNADGESAYLIERAEGITDDFILIANLGENAIAYNDTDLIPGLYTYRVRAANAVDTSAYSLEVMVNTDPASLDKLFSDEQVRLFPNPVKDQLNVVIDSPVNGSIHYRLINAAQQFIHKGTLTARQGTSERLELSLAEFPAGIYWLVLMHESGYGIFEIVKG